VEKRESSPLRGGQRRTGRNAEPRWGAIRGWQNEEREKDYVHHTLGSIREGSEYSPSDIEERGWRAGRKSLLRGNS